MHFDDRSSSDREARTLSSCLSKSSRAPERGRRVWTQSTIWPLARARSRRWSGVIERSGICHVSRQHCRRCGLLASVALLLEADRREERRRAEAYRPAAGGNLHQKSRPAVARRLMMRRLVASRWVADLRSAARRQQHPPRRRRLLCLRDGLRSTRLSISERITETTRLARPRGATSEGVARHSSKRACRRWRHSSTEIFFRRPPKTCRAGVPQSGHFTSSISRRAGR